MGRVSGTVTVKITQIFMFKKECFIRELEWRIGKAKKRKKENRSSFIFELVNSVSTHFLAMRRKISTAGKSTSKLRRRITHVSIFQLNRLLLFDIVENGFEKLFSKL